MAKRRANGEGTITRRKNGGWEAKVSLGYDEAGKRKRKTVYGRTQAEVREKLDGIRQQLATGHYAATKLTVDTYLERWLREKEREVQVSTFEKKYAYCVRKYIVPRIGSIRLGRLTPLQVQTAVGDIADTVGVPTANNCRRVLFTAMRQALRWQLIPHNPVEAVAPLPEVKGEMTLWTPEQAARFLETAREHRLYALFYLNMATGLRRGELFGLRWQDIKGNKLLIRRALVDVGNKLITTTPKSRKGNRRVTIAEDVIEALKEHRERQARERSLLGSAWANPDLVFTSEVGTPLNPGNLSRLRTRLMDKAEVPRIRLHDLRHLHSSICIKNGMDPKMLAERLGHARASFTLDTYTHLFEEQRESSAVSLSDFLTQSPQTGSP